MQPSKIIATVFWVVVFSTILVEGVFQFSWARGDGYNFASMILSAAIIFGWFLADAREREFNPSMALKIAVVAVGALATPYYKFRHFGARAGFLFLAINIVALATVVFASFVADYLVQSFGNG